MSNYQKYTKAQRMAWGAKMAAAREAKKATPTVRGRGAYKTKGAKDTQVKTTSKAISEYTPKGKAPKRENFNDMLLRLGGGMARNMLGSIPGLNMVFGHGDYTVKSNTLFKDSVPQFGGKNRKTYVRHREYICDIVTSSVANTFKIQSFPINPGLGNTFPWLNTIAGCYEEYKIKGMIFEFKSTSADALNSTNTALGTVMMATQYNVLSPDFVNKQQMENYEFAGSCKPSTSLMHPIECDPHETPLPELFIRTDATAVSGADLRMYDFGKFYIATTGMQGTSVNIGELWVTYDICLIKPKLNPNLVESDHYLLTAPTSTSSQYFKDATLTSGSSGFTTIVGTNQIKFNDNIISGVYLMEYNIQGDSTVLVEPGGTLVNCTAGPLLWAAQTSSTFSNAASTSAYYITLRVVTITGPGATITLSGGTTPVNPVQGDLVITKLSATIN